MIQAVNKRFKRSTPSTDKRLEENSNDMFCYYLYGIVNKFFKYKYGHGEMI